MLAKATPDLHQLTNRISNATEKPAIHHDNAFDMLASMTLMRTLVCT